MASGESYTAFDGETAGWMGNSGPSGARDVGAESGAAVWTPSSHCAAIEEIFPSCAAAAR